MTRRVTVVAILVAVLAGGAVPRPTAAGSSTGEVVFRLTIEGPMPLEDAFLLDVECEGDVPLCDPPGNFMCKQQPILDTPDCGRPPDMVGPTSVELSGTLVPQTIHWRLFRYSNWRSGPTQEMLVLSGTWTVHTERQVLSLGYVYPNPDSGPVLPNTAMPIGN